MTSAFRLLCACCRWPDDESRHSAILAAASAIENWDEVTRLADRHRLEPLVVHGLVATGIAVPPPLAAAASHHRALGLRDLAETLRIAAALDQAGIEHRFLKGAPLGVAAFGSALLKRSWDVDLLVHRADAVASAAVLAALDYRCVVPPRPLDTEEYDRWSVVSKEAEFRSPRGTVLELHWGVSDHPHLLATVNAGSPERRIALLGEHCVATLADDANLAYLAVHGSAHAWSRLKWLADFNALLGHGQDPAKLIYRASAFGVGRALDHALALSTFLFGDAPVAPRDRLSSFALVALAADDDAAVDKAAARARWRLSAGLGFRLSELRIRWRGTLDRIDHPLPHSLRHFYPLLRIPYWIMRKARGRRIENPL